MLLKMYRPIDITLHAVAVAYDVELERQREFQRQQRDLVLARRMFDPLAAISDAEFRRHFRFTKQQVTGQY